MSEGLDMVTGPQGQTLYAPVVACQPVNPCDLPPEAKAYWDRAGEHLGFTPPVPDGSVETTCDRCDIAVFMGPKSFETVRIGTLLGLRRIVVCYFCAPQMMAELDLIRPQDPPVSA